MKKKFEGSENLGINNKKHIGRKSAFIGVTDWRRRGEHYRFTEAQTVSFPDAVSQSYTPVCVNLGMRNN